MQHAYKNNEAVGVSEMAIVNTFTKLIFGEGAYAARELAIIDGFRAIEVDVLRDSHAEMGEYLRNLGVREMIQLVSRLHRHLARPVDIASSGAAATTPATATDSSGASRDNPPR